MSSATFYKWRSQYGGMDTSMMSRLKELEDGNRRLKKMYAEEATKGRNHPGGQGKKVVKPSQRREMAQETVSLGRASIRLACNIFVVSETCYRYQPKLSRENEKIADWLIRLANNQRNWGFGLCFLYLTQCKRLSLEPQTGLPNIPGIGAQLAHQT
jgi:putative transposase